MVIGTYAKYMPQPVEATEQMDRTSFAGAGAQMTRGTEGPAFTSLLDRAVGEVDGKMKTAGIEQQKLLTGEATNVHQAMIAVQEASVAFSLMVEVRNKLVESYQEMMRMQV